MSQIIDVAVGVLLDQNGAMLMAQRPEGKPYAGYWEFPGGKLEPGETVMQALQREFLEELDLHIDQAQAWCCVEHVYPHAHVRLHFCVSQVWSGQPKSLEGQAFSWQGQVQVEPVLPATVPLLSDLTDFCREVFEATDNNAALPSNSVSSLVP